MNRHLTDHALRDLATMRTARTLRQSRPGTWQNAGWAGARGIAAGEAAVIKSAARTLAGGSALAADEVQRMRVAIRRIGDLRAAVS